MANTQQGVRHQSARDAAGTVDTYDGDLRALFNAVATVPAGSTFNEAFMLWLQSVTGSSADNINDLAALYASQQEDTYNWSSVGGLGLPTLFDWEPETAEALPDTSTFTRASTAQVLTTDDATNFFYQPTKSGELRLDGQRRIENFQDDPDIISGWSLIGTAAVNGDQLDLPGVNDGANNFPLANRPYPLTGRTIWVIFQATGDGNIDARFSTDDVSQSVTKTVALTGTPTLFAVTLTFTTTTQTRVGLQLRKDQGAGDTSFIQTDFIRFIEVEPGSLLGPPVETVAYSTTYNANVDGVIYLNETNANTVDGGTSVATPVTGTTITGGGYLPEPAATNLTIDADDLSAGSWNATNLTPTDQGVSDIGLRTWRLDAGVAAGVAHTIADAVAGTGDATGSILAKAVAGQFLTLRLDSVSTADYAVFDLTGGTITESAGSLDAAKIKDRASGWYELDISEVTTVNRDLTIGISNTGTPGTGSPTFNGANETIDVAIPQDEATNFSTSRIETSGGTVTRIADVVDTGAVIASAFGALLDVTLPDVVGTGNTISLLGPDATSEDVIRVDASFNIIMDDGGTPATIGTSSAGSRVKVSYGRDATGRSGSLDGATVVAGDAPGAGHEGDTFQLGASNSVNQSRCIHHNSVIYSTRPSDSQLESLSS